LRHYRGGFSQVAGGEKIHAWLNNFYEILELDEIVFQAVIKSRLILPNQNGTLKKKSDLSLDAGDIDPALLDILKLLGNDLRDHLLDPGIVFDLDELSQKNGSFVVDQITSQIGKFIDDRAALDRYRPAISKLLLWFHENQAAAKKLFGILYEQKHRLYDDDEILSNIQQAGQLKELLRHYNVNTVEELHTMLEKRAGASNLPPAATIAQLIGSFANSKGGAIVLGVVEEGKKFISSRDFRNPGGSLYLGLSSVGSPMRRPAYATTSPFGL
jgi:hypothetical protein